MTSKFYVDLSVFRNRYNNLTSFGAVTFSVESDPPPLRLVAAVPWVNGIEGSTGGVEIAPSWRVASWLDLKASYSYLNMNLKNKPGNTDTGTVTSDEGSSPRHGLVLQPRLNLPKRFEFDPTYRYVSALPAQAIKSYSTIDLRVSWSPAERFEFSVVGQNLFQPQHTEFGGDIGGLIGIKRSVYAKFTWAIDGK